MREFVLVRHAHRHVIDPMGDNGLSEKGRLQSLKVKDYLMKHFVSKSLKDRKPLLLHSSPRLRCRYTLEPFAEEIGRPVEINNLLDEAARQRMPMDQRIKKFIRWLTRDTHENVIACSHGDWIPEFFRHVLDREESLKKSGLCRFEVHGDQLKAVETVQEWD